MEELNMSSTLSISSLSALNERIQDLRQKLRAAFINQGPRLEMDVYTALYGLMQKQLRLYFTENATASSSDRTEARQVILCYMQDVLAAALLLVDDEHMGAAYPATDVFPDPPPNSSNPSPFYVSASQRHYCARVFFFLCWSRWVPAHVIIQSLYPLLDSMAAESPCHLTNHDQIQKSAPPSLQNQIAPNLLSRYPSKKKLILLTLNGLLLTRSTGIRSLLRVLFLNDRVQTGMTAEASTHIVKLLIHPIKMAWVDDPFTKTICLTEVSCANQVKHIADQMISLFEEHIPFPVTQTVAAIDNPLSATPRFLKQLDSQQVYLPKETLEERLHIFLTMWLNASLHTPPPSEKAHFQQAYQRLFYVNKYFLTPAFSTLTLRHSKIAASANPKAAALTTLRRVLILAKGTAAGAAANSFLTVFETVAAGFLNLMAVLTCEEKAGTCAEIWKHLAQMPHSYEEIATMLVRGATMEVRGQFYLSNCLVTSFTYTTSSGCPAAVRLNALQRALELSDTPLDLCRACFAALVSECSVTLCHVGTPASAQLLGVQVIKGEAASPPATHTIAPAFEEANPLLQCIETACLHWPADRIFGSQGSLDEVLELLTRTLPISTICMDWSLSLLLKLVKEEGAFAEEPAGGTGELEYNAAVDLRSKGQSMLRVHSRLLKLLAALEKLRAGRLHSGTDFGDYPGLSCDTMEDAFAKSAELEHCVFGILGRMACDCSSTGDSGSDELLRSSNALYDHLASALAAQSIASINVTLMKLNRIMEDASLTFRNVPSAFREFAAKLTFLLMRLLYSLQGDCGTTRVINCLAWLGMYRFDSPDTSILASCFCHVLSQSPKTPPAPPLCTLLGLATQSHFIDSARLARLKVQVLDVLLSWCDYDENGLTLRNVDSYCAQHRGCSLYQLLVSLVKPTEEAVVQVAALHLIGYYVVAVFPRVSLHQVSQLCKDVFRHTRIVMAKAACASMLARVTAALFFQQPPITLEGIHVAELLSIARAMENYHTSAHGDNSNDAWQHDEVIRRHGCNVAQQLKMCMQQPLITEILP